MTEGHFPVRTPVAPDRADPHRQTVCLHRRTGPSGDVGGLTVAGRALVGPPAAPPRPPPVDQRIDPVAEPEPLKRPTETSLAYIALVVASASWAGNWVLARGVNDLMPPMALAFWRWVLVTALLTPFALRATVRDWAIIRRYPARLMLLGVLGTSTFSILGYWGVQYTSGMNAVLLNGVTPVFTVLIGTVVLGDRITGRLTLAVIAGIMGMALIASHGDPMRLLAAEFNRGDLIILLAIFSWAAYTIGLRWKPAGLSGMAFMYVSSIFGLGACVPFWLWEHAGGAQAHFEMRTFVAIAYLALFPSITAYVCYAWAVPRVGHTIAGMFSNVTAILGALFAIVFLGEEGHLYHLLALLLVSLGVWLVSTTRKDA